MKISSSIIIALNIYVFVLSIVALMAAYIGIGMEYKPSYPLSFKIFAWAVLTYPVSFLVAWVLSRYVSHVFDYLPCINSAIVIFIVARFFLRF